MTSSSPTGPSATASVLTGSSPAGVSVTTATCAVLAGHSPTGPHSTTASALTGSSPAVSSSTASVLTGPTLPGACTTAEVLHGPSTTGRSTTTSVLTGSSPAVLSPIASVLTGPTLPGASTTAAILPGPPTTGASITASVLTGPTLPGASTTASVLTGPTLPGMSTTAAVRTGPSTTGPPTAIAVLTGHSSAEPSTAVSILPGPTLPGPSIAIGSSLPGPSTTASVLSGPLPAGFTTASVVTGLSAVGPSTTSPLLTGSSPVGPFTTASVLAGPSLLIPSTAASVPVGSSPSGAPSTASVLTGPSSAGSCATASIPTSFTSNKSLHVSENQKRWIVVGIGMHLVLLPRLRSFVSREMLQFYESLKTSKNIDTQVFGSHMKKDGSFLLNYESINNNKKGKTYDYKVTSAEDLGKLYLQPHMAKFTGFDNTCDLSAVLGILANASVFQPSVQDNAKKVRSQVRNEWGHCNFDRWNDPDFNDCFDLMEALVTSLKLKTADEKEILRSLLEWRVNGMMLCFDTQLDMNLVKLVRDTVANIECLINELGRSCTDEARKIGDALRNVKCEFDKHFTELHEKMEGYRKEQLEQQELFSNALKDHSTDILQLKSKQNDFEATLSSIKDNSDIHMEAGPGKAVAFQVPCRNPYFCGRDSELEAITGHLKDAKNGCVQSAICGLGGVGKTSLVVEFLWRCKDKYEGGIFWISAESNKLFQNSLCEMARQSGTFVENDFSSTFSKTLDWLQHQNQCWALVIDNLDEPDTSEDLRKLLRGKWKQRARGHIIITTRREVRQLSEVTGIDERFCIELNCLPEEDSIQFVRNRADKSKGEDREIRELTSLLGALPLALDQAAAYIRCLRCSVKDYSEQYKKQKLLLLNKKEARDVEENTSRQRLAVHTTWLMNFEHIKSNQSYDKSVREATNLVLEVSSFLCPEEIPFEMINEGLPPINNSSGIVEILSNPLKRYEVLSLLTEFSLFQMCGPDSFRVHRLLQEVVRGSMDEEREKYVFFCAERFLEKASSVVLSEKAYQALSKNKFYIDREKFFKDLDEANKQIASLDEKDQESEISCRKSKEEEEEKEEEEKKTERKRFWNLRKRAKGTTRERSETDLEFEYDAFIMFSNEDLGWVDNTLIQTLEEKYGYKCCVHYRDFLPGGSTVETIANSIYNSRKTVAIVSVNFLNSNHCRFELDYALCRVREKRDNSLVVIKLDDVDSEKFPAKLKIMSYIDYPKSIKKNNWEKKLLKSLEGR